MTAKKIQKEVTADRKVFDAALEKLLRAKPIPFKDSIGKSGRKKSRA